MKQKLNELCEKLLCAGFHTATNEQFYGTRFWKEVTDKTAFVINLKDHSTEIGVLYGYISTAAWFSKDVLDYIRQRGVNDDDVHLRHYLAIENQAAEDFAQESIAGYYSKLCNADKDTILEIARAEREEFMNKVNDLLLVYDFRRRGKQHKWIKNLSDGFVLEFWIDRSSYSDLYYLQVDVYPKQKKGLRCYSSRLYSVELKSANGCFVDKFDLRLQKDYVLYKMIDQYFLKQLMPVFSSPLSELGENSMIWSGCNCLRTHCDYCWVQKNNNEIRN